VVVIVAVLALVVAVLAVLGRRAVRMTGRVRSTDGNDRFVITSVILCGVVVSWMVVFVSRVIVTGAAHIDGCPYPRRSCCQRINSFVDAKVWQ
jgi:hypothetical protein